MESDKKWCFVSVFISLARKYTYVQFTYFLKAQPLLVTMIPSISMNSVFFEASFLSLSSPPGLCSWVVNIVNFYEVFCDVEPKRKALAAANSDLAMAQEKLGKIKAKIKVHTRGDITACRLISRGVVKTLVRVIQVLW